MSSGVKEAYIEAQADKRAKSAGFIVRKLAWTGRRGAPDKFYSRDDTGPFLVEYKAPGETLRPDQVREIAKLRRAGTVVHVIDSIEAAFDLFR
ncbi:VRR-NUC domain-containing protein [Gemmobacter lutimaris]|jgi:LPS sulfotransferase NodH|uniref:VRR-NUC domain-containing protein n=1 Tax=Gemmobacter lutimaris TaxID=2306023 RepID=A0A398BN48_9RHOB|nr:VRR-NUC domain-containing protein [Gemmobacter lutimaris]RID91832.1 VRR-NUC domain-containing protein [Gemmobacter lutimaris]